MTEPLLRALLVAALAVAGLAPPVPCVGPDCPCAESVPGTADACPSRGGECDPCVFCLDCAPRGPEPPALAPAAPGASPERSPGLAAAPAITAPSTAAAIHGLHGADRAGPSPPLPRHIPSVVLRV